MENCEPPIQFNLHDNTNSQIHNSDWELNATSINSSNISDKCSVNCNCGSHSPLYEPSIPQHNVTNMEFSASNAEKLYTKQPHSLKRNYGRDLKELTVFTNEPNHKIIKIDTPHAIEVNAHKSTPYSNYPHPSKTDRQHITKVIDFKTIPTPCLTCYISKCICNVLKK